MGRRQEQYITEATAKALWETIRDTKRPAMVDWVNRTIQVLSEPIVNEQVILSDGPMVYRDVILHLHLIDEESDAIAIQRQRD